MDDFAAIRDALEPRYPLEHDEWTVHQVGSPYPSDLFHFDRSWPPDLIPPWLALRERLAAMFEGIVAPVQPERVGRDFVIQARPPYDGGYSTAMYGEFVDHGWCKPNQWILQALARLHLRALDYLHGVVTPLEEVVHATFVRPWGELFWDGDEGWTLYRPCVTRDQLVALG